MTEIDSKLWQQFLDSNIVEGNLPTKEYFESPWFVKVIQAFLGWLASLFLLAFLALGFLKLIDSTFASFISGIILIGIAFSLLRRSQGEFLDHMALAISMSGQALLIFSLVKATKMEGASAWFVIAVFQGVLVLLIPNIIHRFLSTFFSSIAIYLFLAQLSTPYFFSGFAMLLVSVVFLNEWRYIKINDVLKPVAWGVLSSLIILKSITVFGHRTLADLIGVKDSSLASYDWIEHTFMTAVVIYVLCSLLKQNYQGFKLPLAALAIVSCVLLGFLSVEAEGITVAILLVLLGFSSSHRLLIGLGFLVLLSSISIYYYALHETLLHKSQMLFITGIALLSIYGLMKYLFKGQGGLHE